MGVIAKWIARFGSAVAMRNDRLCATDPPWGPIRRCASMPRQASAIAALIICGSCAAVQSAPASLERIDRKSLCVTNGTVSELPNAQLAIETPSSRAVVGGSADKTADQAAEIRFRYMGPTQSTKPLASGELRRQIGLKLRAQDTCNLIYAMWHIEPDAVVAVSIKRNVGMRTHEQCGAGGYINIKAQKRIDLPPIRPGETHALRAELHGNLLTVTADGKTAWQGGLGNELQFPKGRAGFRTDNARFEFEFYADRSGESPLGRCVMSEGD
jgi:hypothetical protein